MIIDRGSENGETNRVIPLDHNGNELYTPANIYIKY